jgi:nitrite reductase/ring-hydroxylating ferredoxin subunit
VVEGLPHLADGGMMALEVSGLPLLFVKTEGTFYAYHNACPGCEQSLERGVLYGAQLACAACKHHYDVRRAGRCLDSPDLYLEPIPLLVQDGIVKVVCKRWVSNPR